MALLRNSIPMVSLAVSAAALYARAVSSHVRPGLRRLAMLLPVCALFVAIPLAFSSSAVARCAAALLLAWLGTFKLLVLAVGHGPLDPSLSALHFLLAAALPVELEHRRPDDKAKPPPSSAAAEALISCTFKAAAVAAMAYLDQRLVFDDRHRQYLLYVRLGMYAFQVWFSMEVVLACATAACHAAAALAGSGVEVKPRFVRPYLATSLRDFWGRRWNLPVSAVLRAAVYDPVRARAGKEAGIMAAFLVSGLMHEALLCYATLRLPRHPAGGEMSAFFLLHGACRVAEEWCARRRRWPAPPPRALAMVLVWAFMTSTALWLIFLPVYRKGRVEI